MLEDMLDYDIPSKLTFISIGAKAPSFSMVISFKSTNVTKHVITQNKKKNNGIKYNC